MGKGTSDFIIEDGVLKEYHGTDPDIVIPEGVISIAREAFTDALLARSITLPSSLRFIEPSVICIEVYGYEYKLEKVIAPSLEMWLPLKFGDDSSNFLQPGGNLYFGEELVTEVAIPGSFKKVPPYCFTNCRSLKKAVVEEGAIELGVLCFAKARRDRLCVGQRLPRPTFG